MASLSEAAYYASGCRSVTDFLSSHACQGVLYAYLGDDVSWGSYSLPKGEIPSLINLQFSVKKLRAREEQGSLPGFFLSLPTLIPSCTHLGLLCLELASLDELAGLCEGLASPLCTLRSLDWDRVKVASIESGADDAAKRLVKDALVRNTSLELLTISTEILCVPEEHWIPCSVEYLHVKFEGDVTLDVVRGVLTALAHNTISLKYLTITGHYDHVHSVDPSDVLRSPMLESEKQLGEMLSTNTSLTGLHLYNLVMPIHAFSLLIAALNKNPNLTSFTLGGYPCLPGEVVRRLFMALEENCSLMSLDLGCSNGEDWPSASSMLDSLRVNSTLTNVELIETPFEEEAEDADWEEIKALAERNRKIAEQTNALTALHLE